MTAEGEVSLPGLNRKRNEKALLKEQNKLRKLEAKQVSKLALQGKQSSDSLRVIKQKRSLHQQKEEERENDSQRMTR
jgi:hypothetical protein